MAAEQRPEHLLIHNRSPTDARMPQPQDCEKLGLVVPDAKRDQQQLGYLCMAACHADRPTATWLRLRSTVVLRLEVALLKMDKKQLAKQMMKAVRDENF
jgi:hypothetical protein